MTRCDDCGRPLRRPSPDGLGPVCRRKHGPQPDHRERSTSAARPLDHHDLARHGQLAIPIQPSFSDCEPSWARTQPSRRRRLIVTVPGPDTWPREENP
ncbi:hypothetical protein OEIGOIKO_05810 [Streptomyces chrestomyceticus JCM 4735]|uniref:Uncharacterized protein n=1 Tax=Streptomyces chrestomyceticus JCM 4735 TaxID=1306181 RepID=A0A7U9Q0L9_9ACTN|nr:hypothetical protein [Streptomyces chrestomyceticus]GCD38000.1 hypothetical protein OEIGOIKO_05810 [Streptomyces chrestomyceticus JCM 4735]